MIAGAVLAGRYELREQLGGGGMGQVWRGTDRVDGRPIAVKIIGPRLLDAEGNREEALRRFYREAAATRQLTHPHIVEVRDLGEQEGLPFLVLELLHGRDLRSVLDEFRHGLPIDQVLAYGAQVASGLAVAHAAGIVHRDIKPENLMLVDGGVVKICDFGIARVEGASTGLTRTGGIIGTLAYMPPEQVKGAKVDARSDLYALGATLFRLLTGRPVFLGDAHAVAAQHLTAPPPSARAIRPDIPAEIDQLLQTLLAKDPGLRPPNATVVEHRLRTLGSGAADPDPLLASAEEAVRNMDDDYDRLRAVVELGPKLAQRDPRRALGLLSDLLPVHPGTGASGNVRGPRSRTTPSDVQQALVEVSRALAEQAPAVAQEFAKSLRDPSAYFLVRREIALVLIGQSPHRADQLLAELERLAGDELGRNALRADVARVLAEHSPVEAERLARSIKSDDHGMSRNESVLTEIALIIAGYDPQAAERLAMTLQNHNSGRVPVARAVAVRDLAGGRRIIESIADPLLRLRTLIAHARDASLRDPAHATQTLRGAGEICLSLAEFPRQNGSGAVPTLTCEVARLLAEYGDAGAAKDLIAGCAGHVASSGVLTGDRNELPQLTTGARDVALQRFATTLLELRDLGSALRVAETIKGRRTRKDTAHQIAQHPHIEDILSNESEARRLHRVLNETPRTVMTGAALSIPWLGTAVTMAGYRWPSFWESLILLIGAASIASGIALSLRHREIRFLDGTVIGTALATIVSILVVDVSYIWRSITGDADWFLLGGAAVEIVATVLVGAGGALAGLLEYTPLPRSRPPSQGVMPSQPAG